MSHNLRLAVPQWILQEKKIPENRSQLKHTKGHEKNTGGEETGEDLYRNKSDF